MTTDAEEPKVGVAVDAITLFVDDLPRSRAWYLAAFARPVIFEDAESLVLQFENTVVNLLHRSAAHELIAPAPVGPSGAAAQFQLTVAVPAVDRAIERLAECGIPILNGPIDRPWGQRTVCVSDPDNHMWELAESLA